MSALSKSHSQSVRLSLRKVGNVRTIHERTKVYNLTIAGVPAFDTAIGVSHNTEKPIALMRIMVEQSTNRGDLVLDPFMGAGSTALACIQSERHYIGYEIDPKYHAIAEKRIVGSNRQLTLF